MINCRTGTIVPDLEYASIGIGEATAFAAMVSLVLELLAKPSDWKPLQIRGLKKRGILF